MKSSSAKGKGRYGENAAVGLLQMTYWPYAERRRQAGENDKGDISGVPGVCIEVKNVASLAIPQWMRETERERDNAKAKVGLLVVKPRGMGATKVRQWWAIMSHGTFDDLLCYGMPMTPEYIFKWTKLDIESWLQANEGVPICWKPRKAGFSTDPWPVAMRFEMAIDYLFRNGYGSAM